MNQKRCGRKWLLSDLWYYSGIYWRDRANPSGKPPSE